MKKFHIGTIRENFLISLLLIILVTDCGSSDSKMDYRQKYNVLFIAVDDLRPNLGCYGDTVAISPNIDRIAKNGIVFSRAYCQQAVCSPSCSSLMTGLRPDQIGVWDLKTHFRKNMSDVVTLPQYFKQHGYFARSVGKIYHDPLALKDPQSWSAHSLLAVTQNGRGQKYILDKNCNGKKKASATEMADVPDTSYIDGKVCEAALKLMNEMKDSTFFLAVGFRRPHLPFSSPKKYWDLYDPENIPPPVNPRHPIGVPKIALHNWKELRGYTDIPEVGDLTPEKTARLRWGYYAAISYVDTQVGKLLQELKRLNLEKKTIIILWGDHGFHLGEQDLWCKTTNFELDTHAPLIISIPDMKTAGNKCDAIVEFVDIYPTLTDVCGIGIPRGLAGSSLVSFLNDPASTWDKPAISQFPRPGYYKGKPEYMGYSIRTDKYRYTEWIKLATKAVDFRELYNYYEDPNETINLAINKKNKKLMKKLEQKLRHAYTGYMERAP